MKERISVCIPTYNAAETIQKTVESVLRQTFTDFELVIVDNASTDNTVLIIRDIKDVRIKLYINEANVGCGKNLEACKEKATGDILFYICSDDLAREDALQKVTDAFEMANDIGIVIRPYFWFIKSIDRPVRVTKQFVSNEIVSIHDSYDKIKDVIALADQISGIALRKKYMVTFFENRVFIEMASMVADMLKRCKAIILKDNIVGVRILNNESMGSDVYKESPLLSWVQLISSTFSETRYANLKKYLINNFLSRNYIGLVQIKNFGGMAKLLTEIFYLIKFRRKNLLSFQFWFFSLGTILTPRFILRKMVSFYKNEVSGRFISLRQKRS